MAPASPVPEVVAHRGASAAQPENTSAAFDAALADGADGIELDVQLSRDGVAIVYHDWTLARAGGGRRYVASATSDELRTLRVAGRPLPTLRKVLAGYAGRTRLLVELKVHRRDVRAGRDRRLGEAVAAELAAACADRVLALSFDLGTLVLLGEASPGTATVLNRGRPRPRPRVVERELAQVVDVRIVSRELVGLVHAHNKTGPCLHRHGGAHGARRRRRLHHVGQARLAAAQRRQAAGRVRLRIHPHVVKLRPWTRCSHSTAMTSGSTPATPLTDV